MKNLRPPLVEAFKERYRWWSAVELSRRFISVLFIVLFPRHQVTGVNISEHVSQPCHCMISCRCSCCWFSVCFWCCMATFNLTNPTLLTSWRSLWSSTSSSSYSSYRLKSLMITSPLSWLLMPVGHMVVVWLHLHGYWLLSTTFLCYSWLVCSQHILLCYSAGQYIPMHAQSQN